MINYLKKHSVSLAIALALTVSGAMLTRQTYQNERSFAADTARTESDLMSIFADNNNRAIDAQDVRDFVKSVKKSLDKNIVVITRANGTESLYLAAADTNAARGDAMETAVATLSSGDKLWFTGTYEIDSTLTIPANNIDFQGSGKGTAIIYSTATAGSNRTRQIYLNGRNDVCLRDFTLESNQTTLGYEGHGIQSAGTCNRCRIHNVGLNKYQRGIFLSNGTSADFGFNISECNLRLCVDKALWISAGTEYNTINHCQFTENTSAFAEVFAVYCAGGNNSFSNNIIAGNENGVWIDSGGNSGHACFQGGCINHSTDVSVRVRGDVVGYTFIGVQIFSGKIQPQSTGGINFIGGALDGNIEVDITTPRNLVGFVKFMNMNFHNTVQILDNSGGTLSSTSPANFNRIQVINCHKHTDGSPQAGSLLANGLRSTNKANLSGTTLLAWSNNVHTGGAVNCTLPTGADVPTGTIVRIKNAGSGTLTVDRASTDTIFTSSSGQTSTTVTVGSAVDLQWDGSQWCAQ